MRNPFRRREQPAETRSIDEVPWGDGGGFAGPSGSSQDQALRLAPVYSAVRLLADNVSTLPLKAYRFAPGGTREKIAFPQLFKRLMDAGQLGPWLSDAMTSLTLHGNAIGLVLDRDGLGFPTRVDWRPRLEWDVDDTSDLFQPRWYWMGRLLSREDFVHIPWISVPGRALGLSPIQAFALTVNAGLQAQEYGNSWFSSGGIPPGTFKNTAKTVTPEESVKIKQRLVAAIRSREPIVYGADWDFTAMTVPPEQAQFIESQKLTATQIASIYGVPPEMIGGETGTSMTYANVEQQQTNFVVHTLRPWLVRLESAFSSILPQFQYVKFNADALIRADTQTRFGVYEIGRRLGLWSIDDIRELEDLPPLPNGQGADYTPLGTPQAPPALPPAPEPPAAGRHLQLYQREAN